MKIKVTIAVAVLAVVGGYLLLQQQAERGVRRQVETVALRIPDVTAVDYASARIDWPSGEIRIRQVSVSLKDPVESVHIDEVRVHAVDTAHEVPDHLDVEILGVHLLSSQPRLQLLQPYLAEAGYDELALDLHLVYRYDRNRRLLAIEKLEVAADDVGILNLNAVFGNVDLPRLVKNLTDRIYLITALPGVSVAGAELSYADDTLARRLLEAWSRRTHQTPQEAARTLDTALENRFGPADRPLKQEALSALKSFIAAPGTLRMAAAPPAPVAFLRFLWTRSPADIVELLHIQVEG
jgi:hypothetical protein